MSSAVAIARELYREAIIDRGYAPPQTYADLLRIALDHGALVFWCETLPARMGGVQIDCSLMISGSPDLNDYQRMRILAHEFCHWLRERRYNHRRHLNLYQGGDPMAGRLYEEQIARAFERFF